MEICLKHYHIELSYTAPRHNLVLKAKYFDSKIKLSHGLIIFQRERASFLRNSTMQRNEKKFINKIERISVLKKMAPLCLQGEELLA